MPIYVYRCADCSEETEKRQGFADAPLSTCQSCGGSLRRVLTPVGVIFKGSGFYSTDYRNGGKSKAADSTSGDGQAETAGTGGKPESSGSNGKAESSGSNGKAAEASAGKADGGGKAASKTPAASSAKSE